MALLNRPRALLVSAAAAVSLLAAPGAAQATGAASDVLPTGRCLTASATHPYVGLESSSERFDASLSRAGLTINNTVMITDSMAARRTTWQQRVSHSSSGPTRLCMQTNGNLVLRSNGVVVWSTHTAGTGSHNYAMLRDNGRLVVLTGSGRWVWTSGSTAVLLIAGDRLRSGGVLRNFTDPASITRLAMRIDGDLVLSRNGLRVWHSNTHVAGSYMTVSAKGRLLVHTPRGTVIWHSAAVGELPLLTVAERGRLTLEGVVSGHCWARPQGSCG